jgi:hypothetical protein
MKMIWQRIHLVEETVAARGQRFVPHDDANVSTPGFLLVEFSSPFLRLKGQSVVHHQQMYMLQR